MKNVLSVFAILASFVLMACQSGANPQPAPHLDLASIPDGVYSGEDQAFVVKAIVKITMTGGRIESFDLVKHTCSPIGRPAEALVPMILERQTLELDAISGATLSSTAILGAGRNALARAQD